MATVWKCWEEKSGGHRHLNHRHLVNAFTFIMMIFFFCSLSLPFNSYFFASILSLSLPFDISGWKDTSCCSFMSCDSWSTIEGSPKGKNESLQWIIYNPWKITQKSNLVFTSLRCIFTQIVREGERERMKRRKIGREKSNKKVNSNHTTIFLNVQSMNPFPNSLFFTPKLLYKRETEEKKKKREREEEKSWIWKVN